ncbi:MAG: nucleotidyltransferase domain-containing protein [Chloroflexi bacterium]|jgi:predicted nucleotidyltransferase|nr:nucleotidyltransferase domain-containing protein [Chloroflexota bacterium]
MKQGTPSVDMPAITLYLIQQGDVIAAYLFGSVARDQASHLSDVDIAVLLDPDLGLEESVERQLQLMVALDDFADREVQVTVLNRASSLLAYQVVRDGILLYERNRLDRIAFEVRAMKIYFDVKPLLDFHSQALLKRIREVGLDGRARRGSRTLEAAQRIRERLAGAPGR